jgi:hypothetical protein
MPLAGLSESEFKQQQEQLLRQIRATKIEGLKHDLEREKQMTERKRIAVEVAKVQVEQEKVKQQIEETKLRTLRVNLQEEQTREQIAQTKLEGTRDQLSFEKQKVEITKGLYRERLGALDLSLDEETFANDDRRAENKVKEVSMSPKRNYSFSAVDRN